MMSVPGRVLVTGGAGFIGATLVRSLVEGGSEVVVLDDLSSGSADRLPPGVELVEVDVSLPAAGDAVERLRPEAIVHAAAQISVTRSVEDPDRDRAVNVVGTQRVVEAAARSGCRRFVFISSGGAIYGEADGASEDTAARPLSPYGANKLAAEGIIAGSGIPWAVARLSNVYGPGQRADQEGGVVAIFASAAVESRPVVIYGDGEQSRDFVYVGDVVDALRLLLTTDASGIWNVGTGRATTVHDLLAAVCRTSRVSLGHEHAPGRQGEVRTSRLDVDRIGRDLGWSPATSLDDGLRRTLAVIAGGGAFEAS
ncbi:MAG TPA: NAD-dependent epimerase/dehydratase family protein [Candidatus Limnocylindria bacterium]